MGASKHTLLAKICGMREPDSINAIVDLEPDMIGLLCVHKSPRCVLSLVEDAKFQGAIVFAQKSGIRLVGVVQDQLHEIDSLLKKLPLYALQLHGTESPSDCAAIKSQYPELFLIKALNAYAVGHETLCAYQEAGVGMFIFDTPQGVDKVGVLGGSGITWDVSQLATAAIPLPFLIAGGVSVDSVLPMYEAVQANPLFAGFDGNSKLEVSPGNKDSNLCREFIHRVRTVGK